MAGVYDKRSLGPMWASASQQYEPQRTNNFQVCIPGLPGSLGTDIMLAAESWDMPQITNAPINIQHGNSDVSFAGVAQFEGAGTITVIDYIEKDIEGIINQWRKMVYDPDTDKVGWAYQYKKDGYMLMFGPDGTFFRQHRIVGMWPNSVNWGPTMSYETNEVKKITLNIVYDKCFLLNRG